jgi:hypothetical protein
MSQNLATPIKQLSLTTLAIIYEQTFIDTYSKVAFARLYDPTENEERPIISGQPD